MVKIGLLLLLLSFIILLFSINISCKLGNLNKNTLNATEVIQYMSKHGIIEYPSKWQETLYDTKQGKYIRTISELNHTLQQGNDHSWAVSSLKKIENINYPSITEVQHVKILNVPSFYSNNTKKRTKYINILRRKVILLSNQKNLVLNFSNNFGGDPLPMIAGLADLIPKGPLWLDVDNKGHSHTVIRGKTDIHGGLSRASEKIPTPQKSINFKKIILVSNNRTASAAEVTLIALKRNANTKIIGRPTAGLTSINNTLKIGCNNAAAVITVGTIISFTPIHGQTHFNNDPIVPDVTTLYPPISPTKGSAYTAQQPLDADFVAELVPYVQ
ncbi:S41 family peptidase [Lactiplantibacillus plantarum]